MIEGGNLDDEARDLAPAKGEREHLGVRETRGEFFMRLKTAGTGAKGIVLIAARHNGREIQGDLGAHEYGTVDPRRSHLNKRLHGPETAIEVAALAKEKMTQAGCKIRKNAARMLELVFSLSTGSGVDEEAYFADCLAWAAESFGGFENVLCADIHNDQTHPHMHVVMVPIRDGKLAGTAMTQGGPKRLQEFSADLFGKVAQRYGLRPGAPSAPGRPKLDVATDVVSRLIEDDDAAVRSKKWSALVTMIRENPYPLADSMGIDTGRPAKQRARKRTMTDIFTGKGAGSAKEESPRGFGRERQEHLSCVGVLPEQTKVLAIEHPAHDARSASATAASHDRSSGLSCDDDGLPGPFVVECGSLEVRSEALLAFSQQRSRHAALMRIARSLVRVKPNAMRTAYHSARLSIRSQVAAARTTMRSGDCQ